MRKVLGRFRPFMTPVAPLGLASIAAVLRMRGHQVSIIDQYADKSDTQTLVDEIMKNDPDLVGFSCLTPAMPAVVHAVSEIRKINSKLKVVLGNIHAAYFSQELLNQGAADFIVHGEGEYILAELANALEKNLDIEKVKGLSCIKNGNIFYTGDADPVDDLDALPFPAWDLLNLKHYKAAPMLSFNGVIMPVSASRGCPYRCSFCSQNVMFPTFRKRSVEKAVDEAEMLHERFGVNHFGFVDSVFPVSRQEGFNIADELIRRKLHNKMTWLTESRVDLVDYELLARMKEAGLRLIMYGFESGNESVMKRAGKPLSRKAAYNAMQATKKAGIVSLGFFMLGLPGDTVKTCQETIEFSLKLDCDFAKFNRVVPYPGSKLFEQIKVRKKALEKPEYFSSWHAADKKDKLLFTPENMTDRELIKIQNQAVFRFYARPRLILRHLKRRTIKPLTMIKGALAVLRG